MNDKNIDPKILAPEYFDVAMSVIRKIAHDFNNLLTPLVSYPQLIANDLPAGFSGKELLDTIAKTAEDMAHIAKQLLVLSSREQGNKQVFNIGDVIDDLIERLKSEKTAKGVVIESDLEPNLVAMEGWLESAMLAIENACRNSLEAMNNGRGHLLIKAENWRCKGGEDGHIGVDGDKKQSGGIGRISIRPGMYIRLSIADNGPGVPEEIKDSIFLPFVTGKTGESRRGAGLGLSIAYRIMQDHGGYIDYQSVKGKGATFFLYFPAKAEK